MGGGGGNAATNFSNSLIQHHPANLHNKQTLAMVWAWSVNLSISSGGTRSTNRGINSSMNSAAVTAFKSHFSWLAIFFSAC